MKVLLLIAHADDETIGAGGLIPKLLAQGHEVTIVLASTATLVETHGKNEQRGKNISNLEAFKKAVSFYGITKVHILDLKDQYFDSYPLVDIAIKIDKVMGDPDIVISHAPNDLNRDHRVMSEVAKLISRPKRKPISILAMEINGTPAWNADHFCPDLYVDITDTINKKLAAFEFYKNEIRSFPYPYSFKGLEVMAQSRGMESGSLFAEAYRIIRLHHAHLGF